MPIKEFPSIRIDDFRQYLQEPSPEIGFLTHMHEDHTGGLSRKSYYGPYVYCTAATRAMVLNFRTKGGEGELKYGHLRQEVCGKEILRVLDLEKPYTFELAQYTIQVTLIDANHCPGAAMVLIKQSDGPSILFTGDLRCEKWHLEAISRNPSLLPYIHQVGGTEKLSLYVDDTYVSHVDPYKSYMENREGSAALGKLLATYPSEVHFCLADRVTGHEELLIMLAQELKSMIHMSTYSYNFYMAAADSSPLAAKLLELSTTDLDSTSTRRVRIHFCQKNLSCHYRSPHSPMAYFKPCNQPPPDTIEAQNAVVSLLDTVPGMLVPFEEDSRVFKGPQQRYFLDKQAKLFYPLFPWFYFSRHASYPELCQFRDIFNVCSVRSIHGTELPSLVPHLPDNDLSIVGRRGMILRYEDRTKINKLRKDRIMQSTYNHDGSLPSDDEHERHAAMTLLCKPPSSATQPDSQQDSQPEGYELRTTTDLVRLDTNKKHPSPEPILSTKSHSQTGRQGCSHCGTQGGSQEDCFAPNKRQRLDESSLPSPPSSPCEVNETIDDCQLLVEQLRENPTTWFELSLDYCKK